MGREYLRQLEIISNTDINSNVITDDGFETTLLKWETFNNGAGATTLDGTMAFRGEKSLKMVTGANINNSNRINQRTFFPAHKTIRLQMRCWLPTTPEDLKIEFGFLEFVTSDGSSANMHIEIEFIGTTLTVRIEGRGGANQIVVTPTPNFKSEIWNIIALEFIPSERKITKLIMAGEEHNIDQTLIMTDGSPDTGVLQGGKTTFKIETLEAVAKTIFIDDIQVITLPN